MRRLNEEDGAVAVLIALLLVVMIGMTAIVVDVGALYDQRRQLQNGADSAALAIAEDCAREDCTGAAATSTATEMVDANSLVLAADASVTFPDSNRVSVSAVSTVDHWFAPVLGYAQTTDVGASSTAVWGPPARGRAMLPITFSWCTFQAVTGGGVPSTTTPVVINYQNQSTTGCTGPSGKHIPAGFGWLQPDADRCTATSDIDTEQTVGKPGNSVPGTCTAADFQALQDATVLLPLFEEAGGTGQSGWYGLIGYAAFRITGYRFSGEPPFNWNAPCSGDSRCIGGYFTEFVDLSANWELGGPSYGASVVELSG